MEPCNPSRSHFAGEAAYGYCPSKSQVARGMRLVLFCDGRGVPTGYDLVGPKTGKSASSPSAASRHRLSESLPAKVAKARIRLVVESVFSTRLKRQMRPETHLAKAPGGFAQRLLALTLGVYVNTLLGHHRDPADRRATLPST